MQKIKFFIIALLGAIVFGMGTTAQAESGYKYIECRWVGGNTDGHVETQTKEAPDRWIYDSNEVLDNTEYYYRLRGTKKYNKFRYIIRGNIKFVLWDGCKITFTKGLQIEEGSTLTIYAQSTGSNMGKLIIEGSDGDNAAIGGNDGKVGGNLIIHGGNITVKPSSNNAAGLGGGNGSNSGMKSVTIYGGTINATGKSSGAGIGCGQNNNTKPTVTIYGGTITATGGDYAAGIGGSEDCNGGTIKIFGGTVNAQGGQDGAGIGGGEGSSNGTVYIYGGTVNATGGNEGAGIGGGEYHNGGGGGGTVYIYGGTVTATAGKDGSGIGGGKKGAGANVYIYGGTVTAKNVENGWAIGGGYSCSQNGSVTLGSDIQVRGGGTDGGLVTTSNRVSYLMSSGERTAMVCTHEGCSSYISKDDYYHHFDCNYCEGYDEQHTKGDNDKCTKCSHSLPEHSYTFYEINEAGDGYASEGTAYYVTSTNTFTFPDCSNVRKPLYFAGWLQANSAPETLITDGTEDLILADSTITIPMDETNRNYYARYTEHAFSGGEGTQSDPFLISTTDDWTELATAVGNGYNFNGLYLQLTNDLSVTTMVGQGSNRFRGIFDGQGHTITVSYTGITEDYCAPFRHISGATIKNLNTTGTIETSGRYAAGVVAYTRYYSTIENCRSSVTIRSNREGWAGHGGILGLKANVSYSEPTVDGCVFDGKILSTGATATTGGGGIVGLTNGQTLTVKNCLYKLATLEDGETPVACSTIYANSSTAPSTVTCTDCYYTEAYGSTESGTQAYTVTSGTEGLTLDFGDATTTYEYDGIKVNNFGLLYGDKLYTASGTSVTFTPKADQTITNLQVVDASTGSVLSVPTNNGDGTYTLTMPSKNVKVTSNLNPYTVTLRDAPNTEGEPADPTNSATIDENHGNIADVTITGRTLYKDGDWNTLCLPFNVTAAQIAISDHPLYGCTIMELDTEGIYDTDKQTGFDGETLYLYFKNATAIEAGVPYLVKWTTTGSDILSPKFPYSEIKDHDIETIESEDGKVSFIGNFDPVTLTGGDQSVLYLGTNNQLYWPTKDKAINAFRAYFQLNGITASEVHARLFFGGDDATGITNTNDTNHTNSNNAWYTLDGRKLQGKPTQKGLYIYKGKKVVIK